MEHLLRDIAAHGLKNRKVAFLENGTWAAMATKQMKAILEPLSGTEFIPKNLVIKSAIRQNQKDELEALVAEIVESLK
jgi:flavorubredoxin